MKQFWIFTFILLLLWIMHEILKKIHMRTYCEDIYSRIFVLFTYILGVFQFLSTYGIIETRQQILLG